MSILNFGRNLIRSLDLDPVYVALHRADLPKDLLRKWLLAYWCFYHSGVASRIASATCWHTEAQSLYPSCPRGAERRHFRGKNGQDSLDYLRKNFPNPGDAVLKLEKLCPCKFSTIAEKVREWKGFGPWIAFKAADMLERVVGSKIDFTSMKLDIYDEPAKAAKLIDPHSTPTQTATRLAKALSEMKAPPLFDREINVQEAETVLCKYKAHIRGHYPIGKDSRELKHSLKGWGILASKIAEGVP